MVGRSDLSACECHEYGLLALSLQHLVRGLHKLPLQQQLRYVQSVQLRTGANVLLAFAYTLCSW